ncbi:hypothetical protein J3E69DRAFT_361987 [Trichoderma sp. SZMC 28015]
MQDTARQFVQQLLTDVHEDFVRSSPNQSFTLMGSPSGEFQGKSLFNTAISFQKDNSSNGEVAPDKIISLERLWSKDPTEYDIVLGVADRRDALLVSLYFYDGRIPETD